MSAAELLLELSRLGIALAADGDRLRYCPRSALTPELLAAMREHKAAVMALLATPAPPAWQAPTAQDLANARLALGAFYPPAKPQAPTAGQCRCGSTDWTDVAIHNGQSIRRDCGRCGRFLAFVQWQRRRFDN